MTGRHLLILRIASLAVPSRVRSEWLRMWESEYWYIPREAKAAFCVGALKDSALLWLENPTAVFDWPFAYLLALSVCSAATYIVGVSAAKVPLRFYSTHAGDGRVACVLLFLLLIGIGVLVGKVQGCFRPTGLRDTAFLIAKLAAAVPIFYGTLFIGIALHAPLLHPIVIFILVVRAAFSDQSRRCPRCLHYIFMPVSIGTASDTFLQWYGTEAMCSRCRALLQMPHASAAYCAEHRLLRLDGSWDALFAGNVESRP